MASNMMSTVPEKHIEQISVASLYHTGIPEWFECSGLRFHWYSWLLCEIALHKGNPVHHAIFTNFRTADFEKVGRVGRVTVARWNPSYEGDEHKENLALDSLWFWRPVSIVLLDH